MKPSHDVMQIDTSAHLITNENVNNSDNRCVRFDREQGGRLVELARAE